MTANNITLGLDLGDRRHAVCVLSAAGDIIAETEVINTRECLTVFASRHPGATFVMETGTHSPWVSRLLEALGHHVIVANARKLRAISQSITKSDEEDARMLARLGRADPQLLSPVKHRSESAQRALVQLKVREALVRLLSPSSMITPTLNMAQSFIHLRQGYGGQERDGLPARRAWLS